MIARVLRFFSVMPEEAAKVAFFAVFGALLQGGVAVGMTAKDSLFLTHLGPGKLPIFFLCMAVYAPAYAALLGRFRIERALRA